ncbi:Cytochrome c-type biogenesis protein CcmE, heme chaperone [hydrothermal vent metagenome]|uniref:Cytochrome c-type biogenesis protein CcmE, heme chaperone n=1 Tax=hydrothermal vent metagenome TaxID=652676 RepID=A0A3B0SAU5_9ZZZZ
MKPKKQNQRLVFLAVGLLVLTGALALAASGLKDNISYFYAPTELLATPPEPDKKIRLGGMVKQGSFKRLAGLEVVFTITDFENEVPVTFVKILPDLFREGQGVIAEGVMQQDGTFLATRVLAKHDENYMPPEVADSLKNTGDS